MPLEKKEWSFKMAEFGNPGRHQRSSRTGQTEEEKQFDERVVSIDRVARVVKGGRRFRFRALVVVGDRKGKAGAGIAKGADVTTAITKAIESAKKKLRTVSIVNGTIPHEITAKAGGAKIMLKPAAPGTGLIAGGVVRTIVEVAGITNILSKSHGSSNKINMAYATLSALEQIEHPDKWHQTSASKPKASKPKATPKKAAKPKVETKK